MGNRQLFEPHEEAIWQQLSHEIGGEFIDKEGWSQDRVRASVDEWAVILDMHAEPGYRTEMRYTRFRAPYVNADGFRFNIYHESIFAAAASMFSHEYAKSGYNEIDTKYTIKTNNADKFKRLVDGSRLRAMLAGVVDIHLFVRDTDGAFSENFPDEVDELVLEVEGEVDDIDRLKRLYVLFAACLQRLCAIGSAYVDDPNVEL